MKDACIASSALQASFSDNDRLGQETSVTV